MAFVPAKDFEMLDFVKALIHGNTGAGKSHLGATAKRPAIALCEKQALRTIRLRNPEADIWVVESSDDLREMLGDLKTQLTNGTCPYDSVMLDSLTEIQSILKREVLTKAGSERETLTQGEWGVIIDRVANIARAFRDLPLNVMVLTRSEESYSNDERYVRPSLSGKKLPNDIAGFFNICGYIYKKVNEHGDLVHRVLFDGTEGFTTKGDPELDAIEVPSWPLWIRKMYGAEAPGAATDDEAASAAAEGQRELKRDGKTKTEREAEEKAEKSGGKNTKKKGAAEAAAN